MNKKVLLPLSIIAIFALTGCFQNSINNKGSSNSPSGDESSEDHGSAYDYNTSISVEDPEDIDVEENEEEFKMTTKDGEFTKNENIYTILKAGTYAASGKLEGQILVDAGDDDEVVIELSNATIIYDKDSPIKAINGDKLEISAKKETGNVVIDNRSVKTVDDNSMGEGAINAKMDLKLKGAGTLVVTGNYNNGIHTTKDLTIQKQTLKVTGYNNAIKGKNSVTITSGEIQAYALTGNGIKTENTDVSSKGNQRGSIFVNGGSLYVDSLHDALDASYDIHVDELDSEVPTTISIKTGIYSSSYDIRKFTADSEKGLKAQNNIVVSNGTVVIAASDDAMHANYGDQLDNGKVGEGNIFIDNGLVKIASGDDGLHADNMLTINGGVVVVTGAVEGLEATLVNIAGGSCYIYGSDDGVNASKKSDITCGFVMSNGYLDIAVTKGDTDGIDSNGYFDFSGGIIVTRGSPGTSTNRMSTGLDVDGECRMSGGTLIAFNGLERKPTTGTDVNYAGTSNANQSGGGPGGPGGPGRPLAASSFAAGHYRLSGDGLDINFINDFTYASFMVYSSSMSLNSSYTLAREDATVLSWTQSSKSVTIS